ncbi:MAG: hypothetical protein TU36_002935 [Vulcanisaeta sp. AZ3]
MNSNHCIRELMNLMMSTYSIIVVEHYMILMMLEEASKGANLQDQLINVLRDHLDKEIRVMKNIDELRQCLDNDTIILIEDFLSNVTEGSSLTNDPEFLSNYIHDFTGTLKPLIRYMLTHEELFWKFINRLREVISSKMRFYI